VVCVYHRYVGERDRVPENVSVCVRALSTHTCTPTLHTHPRRIETGKFLIIMIIIILIYIIDIYLLGYIIYDWY
jgi:hypothetical protein